MLPHDSFIDPTCTPVPSELSTSLTFMLPLTHIRANPFALLPHAVQTPAHVASLTSPPLATTKPNLPQNKIPRSISCPSPPFHHRTRIRTRTHIRTRTRTRTHPAPPITHPHLLTAPHQVLPRCPISTGASARMPSAGGCARSGRHRSAKRARGRGRRRSRRRIGRWRRGWRRRRRRRGRGRGKRTGRGGRGRWRRGRRGREVREFLLRFFSAFGGVGCGADSGVFAFFSCFVGGG